ncbi:MAG: Cys-tRNA(Pro) deacylase [Lentisphaeria bacterium]|nr:Cys-tRNA(Pro) deacylase [Lentisphaerota bacterium]MBR7143631.1 Cys-tRNA(Pro) deacylase [Lentisphaeria bacterium]
MANPSKTNAIRLLENSGIAFTAHEYDTTDGEIDARSIARKLGVEEDRVFKTLVAENPDKEHFVFVVPAAGSLNLKKAAKTAGVKSIAMIKQKELLPLTGYIHGGCSPIGMKKPFPTFIDETAILFDKIFVSGGKVGLNLEISPEDLAGFVNADFSDLC